MILRTTTPQEFRECRALLTSAGYTQVNNAILPNHIAGDNYIEVAPSYALFALASQSRADKDGYTDYSNSQFIKNLKR